MKSCLVFLASILIRFSDGQILPQKVENIGGIEKDLIARINDRVKLKNSHLHAIATELTQFCETENSVCEEGSADVIKHNVARFSKVSYLLQEDAEKRQDVITGLADFAADIFMAAVTATLDSIFLVLNSSVEFALSALDIAVQLLVDIGTALGDLSNAFDKAIEMIGTVESNMEAWAKILGLDKIDETSSTSGFVRRNRNDENIIQAKKEKLVAVLQMVTYGFIVGEGDALTAVQFGSSAFASYE